MKAGISVCSDGQKTDSYKQNEELKSVLKDMEIEAVFADHIYETRDVFSGTDMERAADLMKFYQDDTIDVIFDISGGNLANGVLKYLDYDIIARSEKMFWGYSDLTALINAVYTKTGRASVLYSVKNLVYSRSELQRRRFSDYIRHRNHDLFDIDYHFLQGDHMSGTVLGGNIRCFLKLAGTPFWPDLEGKILLLESLGGESGQIASMLNQLDQTGAFEKVSGILLGTFTSYEKANPELSVYDLLKTHIDDRLPAAQTRDIGHGSDAKAIVIGAEMRFSKEG